MFSTCSWSTQRFLRARSAEPLRLSSPLQTSDSFELYHQLTSCSPLSYLLESGGENRALAHYSFIGCEPYQTFSAKGRHYELWNRDGNICGVGDVLSILTELFTASSYDPQPNLPPFVGGAVGFLSYDLVRQFERIPEVALDDLQLPDVFFMFVELSAAIDHVTKTLHLMFAPDPKRWLSESRDQLAREGTERLQEWQVRLLNPCKRSYFLKDLSCTSPLHVESQQTRQDYIERVETCKGLIAAGDIYQANLSHRFRVEVPQEVSSDHRSHGAQMFQQVRQVNPSPFSALMLLNDFTIVSNSPERLVRLEGQRADIRPIAGTRPRASSIGEDRQLIEELLRSPKERAEHLMLVDLARNDLGRVCRYGTISTDQLMVVERYSHVSHLVSNITGLVCEGITGWDVLRAAFPGGTITGVPKVHCMEIIEQLEPVRRGVYTGSLGYMSWTGDMDMNILIRTLLLTSDEGYLQVGAGIVADSSPRYEYDETLHKAKAFFQAFR